MSHVVRRRASERLGLEEDPLYGAFVYNAGDYRSLVMKENVNEAILKKGIFDDLVTESLAVVSILYS